VSSGSSQGRPQSAARPSKRLTDELVGRCRGGNRFRPLCAINTWFMALISRALRCCPSACPNSASMRHIFEKESVRFPAEAYSWAEATDRTIRKTLTSLHSALPRLRKLPCVEDNCDCAFPWDGPEILPLGSVHRQVLSGFSLLFLNLACLWVSCTRFC
jgi:hypothetical protein